MRRKRFFYYFSNLTSLRRLMTSLWRHFDYFLFGNHKIINSNRMEMTNTSFNMFSMRKNEIFVIFQIWRHYDVIFTIFSSEIIKSSIKIVWKWLIPLFNMFPMRTNEVFVIFQIWRHYDIMMLLWRHFHHFCIENEKVFNTIRIQMTNTSFNVFWVRKKRILIYFSNLTPL